jgi:hypothetical protein
VELIMKVPAPTFLDADGMLKSPGLVGVLMVARIRLDAVNTTPVTVMVPPLSVAVPRFGERNV